MKISVIIPVYNEKNTIGSLLNQLEEIKDECEIIFVDGGSRDGTLDLVPEGFTVMQGQKGRAGQMNLGAGASSGDVLFFLHCDSMLPKEPLREIQEVMKDHRAGCFGVAFSTPGFLMGCCQALSNFRVRFWKIAFGDQGIFIERDLFFELGGFPEIPIMEDYQFSLELRKRGIALGMTKNRIYTSDRRYVRGGIIRTMWKMYRLRRMYRKGVDIDIISGLYKDIR